MKILIRGAGDLATGIAHRLRRCGFDIVMTDIPVPTTVRRSVAYSRAIYENKALVEEIEGILVESIEEIDKVIKEGKIAVIIDETGAIKAEWNPEVIVDAIIAKRNVGTKITDAPLVIGIGPGFTAKVDCHYVIETKRGHYLGKVIEHGSAIPNTGVPGEIGGYSIERIIRASDNGIFYPLASIGDKVELNQRIAMVDDIPVYALMPGMVRGMLQSGIKVSKGMKCGDIDARCELEHCYTISDKARAIGGGVLEAILMYNNVEN